MLGLMAIALLVAFATPLLVSKPAFAAVAEEQGFNELTLGNTSHEYSASGTVVSITASLAVDTEFDASSYRFEVDFESGETKEFSGNDIFWRDANIDGQGVKLAAVSFEVVGVQEISYRLYCGDELLGERTSVRAVKPLALSPDLLTFDKESKTVTPVGPGDPSGTSSSPTIAETDVRCYAVVNGVNFGLEEWDPSLPGTHTVMAVAASDNVTGKVVLCAFTVSEEAAPEISVPQTPVYPEAPNPEMPSFDHEELSFDDVPEGAWFEDAVYGVVEAGIMDPDGETTFGVRSVLTRGETAQLVMELLGGSPEKRCAFSDVSEENPFAGAIEWVRSHGIMAGYAGTTCFGPSDPLTQEQAAAVLFNVRVATAESPIAAGSEVGILADIQGGDQVSAWAQGVVAWALENEWKGVLSLNPQGALTRGWAAVRVFEGLAKSAA